MKKQIVSMLLVLVMLLGLLPAGVFAAEAAEPTPTADAVVTMTVSNQGVLAKTKDGTAMANKEVTVKDINGDGKLTYHEALVAAHAAYAAESDYGTAETAYGTSVTKLWGVETTNTLFFVNGNGLSMGVGADTVKEGDALYASVNQDAAYYSDKYTWFSTTSTQNVLGQALKLTLKGNLSTGEAVLPDMQIGLWKDGKFVSLSGMKTDENGQVSLTFTEYGTYYVTATGTVSDTVSDYSSWPEVTTLTHDCPIMAPVCVVNVIPAPSFSNMELYLSANAYENGEAPLKITPVFDPGALTGYSVTAPDYLSSLYLVATLSEQTVASGWSGFVFISNNWGGWQGTAINNGVVKRSANFASKGYLSFYFDGMMLDGMYQVDVNQFATLKGLTIDGVWDAAFNRDTTTYHVYADSTKTGIAITPTGYKSGYTVTVNGTEVTGGEEYTLAYNWDANGKMKVEIVVSGSNVAATTYTVELEKKPLNDAPFIMTQPKGADYTVIDTAVADLYVDASANGELAYQWYWSSTDSTENGTKIEGATASSYTPPITEDVIGTRYYYCVITNTGKAEGNVTVSNTARVTVDPDPTPVAIITNPGTAMPEDGYEYPWNKGYVYVPGEDTAPLTVTATSAAEGGEWTYKWWGKFDAYSSGYMSINGETDTNTYTPSTALSLANDAGMYYACQVTYTFKGRDYTVWATTGDTYTTGEGEDAKTYDVVAAYVFLKVASAATPEITKQPAGASYIVGNAATALSVSCAKADGGTLTYQWYENTSNSNEGGVAIEGATRYSYSISTEEASNKYYYCVITNTIQGKTASVTSDAANITVSSVADIIGGRLNGSGTEEDPYLISDAQDYQDLADIVAAGVSFSGSYFKQTADITLPEGWEPIGVRKDPSVSHINKGQNMHAFSGILDGCGYTITIPEGGLPLLGYVKGATVKNLNIYGRKIAGYGLVNNLEGVGLSGEAICIDNVTLKSGSSTLKSGLIGTYITNNGFAGCSAAFYVTIKNCTIEKDVVIGYDKDQSMIGSIAGRIHGTIENCVSYATVYGTDYVGGILGTRDNAMGTCFVTDSQFHGTVEASGEQVGGIAGGGYCNSTAPNGVKISVNDCTVTGSVTGADMVGGILGGDKYVAQSWGQYSFKNNSFTGTVQATTGTYTGSIIGYYLSMNKMDDISGNTYSSTCGTDKWIGGVGYLDTNCATHETASSTLYINTETTTENCPTVAGCNWKTAHNRTDDPLGADAHNLAAVLTDEDQTAADAVIAQIAAIGEVTLDAEEAILAARAAYDALTEEQKALVTNYDVLTAAEAKLQQLKDETAAPPVEVYVTIANKGNVVMFQQSITVADMNRNGIIDVDDALFAAHEAGFEGGAAAGYATEVTQYGLGISKLWGDTSYCYGYWLNNASCWSLEDVVADGNHLVAFVYTDATNWSDAYTKFDAFNYAGNTAEDLVVKLEKAGYDENWNTVFSAHAGAVITVYDSEGKALTEGYTVTDNGDGTYAIRITAAGSYYVVATDSDPLTVPAVCQVVVTYAENVPPTGQSAMFLFLAVTMSVSLLAVLVVGNKKAI